jgi:membrane-associated phospholipid phosphatase
MLVYSLVLFFLLVYKAGAGTLPRYFYALPLSGVAVTSIFLLINRWIKISLHGAGAGILLGFLIIFTRAQDAFSIWWVLSALLAAGLTMAARLYLQKHTSLEVYTGFIFALLITAGIHQFLS